ncbi:hypothetical protein [Arthrobacter pityocampae]|uniref:hypothetical protein n=1 Tax=Arthrobacter pityocampae TaxID=547334 RepID=UPI0011B081CA|nr:hypothetical protein [Arthrobacter pityocampae]
MDPKVEMVSRGVECQTSWSTEAGNSDSHRLGYLCKELLEVNLCRFENVKVWFYRPNCLVLDFFIAGHPIAIDLVDDSVRITVKLAGRNQQAEVLVDKLMHKSGTPKIGGRYYLHPISIHGSNEDLWTRVLRMVRALEWRI